MAGRKARTRHGEHERDSWPLAVFAVFALSGVLFVASAVTADGSDLRPAGGDVGSLLKERSDRVAARRVQAQSLRQQIDQLTGTVNTKKLTQELSQVATLGDDAGLSRVEGPGLKVTLDDAPRTVSPPGIDPNDLVVHQQDIQAFVNALWAGGAQAVTLQGQRLVSTTGIKCVGNTVVLDGVPYSPPYVIRAVGDQAALIRALQASPEVTTYRQYADVYQLGLGVEDEADVVAKPYAGTVELKYAHPVS